MSKGLRTAHYAVSVAVLAAALLAGGNYTGLPADSEVGFSSLSPLGVAGGAVIPASCESGFAHFPGECAPPPPPPPPPPPSVDIKVNGSDGPLTFEALAGYTASWMSIDATSCTASGSWGGAKPTLGEEGFADIPRGTYTYTLTCTNAGGSTPDSVTVNVINVPQCTFVAVPDSITLPETSTLSWSCSFANSCAIDQGIGAVSPVSGSEEVQPPHTTTYTLTCEGDDGPRDFEATVRVFDSSRIEIRPAE